MSGGPNDEDRIREEAAMWLARRRMQPSESLEAAFTVWMAANARHAAAYTKVSKAADLVAELKAQRDARSTVTKRRRFTWPLAAGMALAAAAILFVLTPRPWHERHQTAIAQIEEITLSDGSIVTLGPASRLDARFTRQERRIVLAAGEAFFQVRADVERPFLVQAGAVNVRVVGTKFDVRRGAETVRVSVAEGIVRLRYAPSLSFSRPDAVVLTSGDQAETPEHAGMFAPQREIAVSPLPPSASGAWRQGHLAYVDAPLSFIVADLNRYYAPGVRLSDPALGRVRLTASFRAEDSATFLDTLPAAAPVVVTRASDGEVTIAPTR